MRPFAAGTNLDTLEVSMWMGHGSGRSVTTGLPVLTNSHSGASDGCMR